jgi:hypothetical protein
MTPMIMTIPGTMTREDRHRRSGNVAEERWGDMAIRDLLKNRLA